LSKTALSVLRIFWKGLGNRFYWIDCRNTSAWWEFQNPVGGKKLEIGFCPEQKGALKSC